MFLRDGFWLDVLVCCQGVCIVVSEHAVRPQRFHKALELLKWWGLYSEIETLHTTYGGRERDKGQEGGKAEATERVRKVDM